MASAPIDHKDEPGEYRQRVRSNVFDRVGVRGEPVASADQFVGSWRVHFVGMRGETSGQSSVYRLSTGGRAVVESAGQPPAENDRWRLNADGSVSWLVWCAAMPEYGLPEPTYQEQRMHAAALSDGRLVLWNGDGSLVKLLSPLQPGGHPAPSTRSPERGSR